MFFRNTICSKCDHKYDSALEFCPFCDENNSSREFDNLKTKTTWLPLSTQIILFLTGSFGFLLASLILSPFALTIKNEVKQNMFLNVGGYLLIFIALTLILLPYLKYLIKPFRNYKNYIFGFLVGIGLIGVTIIIGNLISWLYPSYGHSANEATLEMLYDYYPLEALIVFSFIGPICEEITYRLGLFSFLRRKNAILAYILTAVIFGLIHFSPTKETLVNELLNLITYLSAGVILSLTYDKLSFVGSLTAHITNNFVTMMIMLITQ